MAMTPEMRGEIRKIVEEIVEATLLSDKLRPNSIIPSKIRGIKNNGTEPANGSPLIYDATTKTVRF